MYPHESAQLGRRSGGARRLRLRKQRALGRAARRQLCELHAPRVIRVCVVRACVRACVRARGSLSLSLSPYHSRECAWVCERLCVCV